MTRDDGELLLECIVSEGVETKPEPDVVAAALIMSEEEGDLGSLSPNDVFNKLFPSNNGKSMTFFIIKFY